MARITVEDCLDKVENRFQLVLIATKRARQLASGAEPLVDRDNDKNAVIALREIAQGLITEKILDEDDSTTMDIDFDLAAATKGMEMTQDEQLESSDADSKQYTEQAAKQ